MASTYLVVVPASGQGQSSTPDQFTTLAIDGGIPTTLSVSIFSPTQLTTTPPTSSQPNPTFPTGSTTTVYRTVSISSSPTGNANGGIGGAEAAGIAIGCLVAGAIIASLIIFFFVRPKYRRRSHGGYANDHVYVPPQAHPEKGAVAAGTVQIPQDSSAAIVENYLPQPPEDETIKSELSKLKDKINGHVHSFYHSGPANDQAAISALTQVLGNDSPLPAARIPQLLSDPQARSSVLRFAVAWIVISRLGLECDPGTSFLPWQVVSCAHAMPKTKMDDKPRMAFLSKWRQITSALFPASYYQPTIAKTDPRGENVRKALQLADAVLRPYANPNDEERLYNLEEIMKRAARFAYLLFSHPSFWRFDWQDGGDGLVVFPGLLQFTNEAGTLLPQPILFSQREVIRV